MGLEDFTDSSSSSTNTSTEKQKSKSKTTVDTGEHKQYGPFGYETFEDYEETIEELDFEVDEGLMKFRMPIFPMITTEDCMSVKTRYKIKPMMKKFSCISSQKLKLYQIPREMVMLDAGQTEIDNCLEALSERFNQDVTPETEVWFNILTHTRSCVKLALGNETAGDVSTYKRDEILKAVYNEAYTRQFRSNYLDNMKSVTDIEPW